MPAARRCRRRSKSCCARAQRRRASGKRSRFGGAQIGGKQRVRAFLVARTERGEFLGGEIVSAFGFEPADQPDPFVDGSWLRLVRSRFAVLGALGEGRRLTGRRGLGT